MPSDAEINAALTARAEKAERERDIWKAEALAGRAWKFSRAPGGSDKSLSLNLAWSAATAAAREIERATDASSALTRGGGA